MSASTGALRIGQVLATSYAVVMRNLLLFFALAFLANIPNLVIDFLVPAQPPPWMDAVSPGVEAAPVAPVVQPSAVSLWLSIPFLLSAIVLSFIFSAAATFLMIADLRGTRFSLVQALTSGVKALLPLLGVVVLMLLMFLGFALLVSIAWALVALAILGDPKSPVGFLVFLAFIVPVMVVAIRLSLIVPVVVVEGLGPMAAIKRSAELTQGNGWSILGAFLLLGLIFMAINVVVAGAAVAMLGMEALANPIVTVAGHVLVSAEIPFYWALIAVIYYYLRSAAEGGENAGLPTV